ncbi:MAG: UDP-N-acetylmuramate:L-alanyl-gamma-D-glutamyl-meso-diaminopimelate ligase [Desulfobacteraceae bacterium]|jgi:UDP-N-acetylmuramate: L-alanyl-gamma-D-glutamyl-meso-diaminopimelate ligase
METMDLSNNTIPSRVKTVHLTAVCGTAMGAVASMLKEQGYGVTGSDQKVYPPMSDFLRNKGIAIMEGFRPENLDHNPDLVVVGNAVSKDNPEVVAMFEKKIPFCSMPQAVNHFFAKGKKTLVVSGTHGKTTTSSLLAHVLYKAGLDPSYLIGGIVKNFNSNFRIGKGNYLVLEGDEYDTAFFDKGSKFLHYSPDITILTSVEFDHADIFRDLEHVKSAFESFIAKHPRESLLVAADGYSNIDDILQGKVVEVERYGIQSSSFWKLDNIRITPPYITFEVLRSGKQFGSFKTRLPGEHNLYNALSVIASAHRLGIPMKKVGDALESFEGVKRRQEIRGEKRGVTVMDDFAHHPTAVKETIKALKPFYPDGRLIAVFEPRTNSSMRDVFQDVYPESFDEADLVLVRKPPHLDKIPEDHRFSSEKLVADLGKKGVSAYFFETTEGIIDYVIRESKSGDLVLIMSNGGFDQIHDRILAQL